MPPGQRKPASVGTTVGPEIAILNDAGERLAVLQPGEVVVRGPGVFRGYENDPEENARTFAGDWYRTGDLGYLDEDGYLFLTGRTTEVINRGGAKITPQEIDDVLRKHPSVRDATTFPLPHPTLGEELAAAVVVTDPECDADTLREFCARFLTAFKIPRTIVIVPEIPKGATGKVQRVRMAALFRDELARAQSQEATVAYEAPRTPLEELLVGIWMEVLEADRVGIHDRFSYLGGDSLQATRVAGRVSAALDTQLPLHCFLEHRTVGEQALAILENQMENLDKSQRSRILEDIQ